MDTITSVEYRVRKVERYIVTRYHSFESEGGNTGGGGCDAKGEFDSHTVAHAVAYALCKAEHDQLGWLPGDERIQYPKGLENDMPQPNAPQVAA